MNKVRFDAMGTWVEFIANESAQSPTLQACFDKAEYRMRILEQRLSRFQKHSDVSQVNARPNEWVPVHEETMQVIQRAIDAHQQTSGLFNPCLGRWLVGHGYDATFERMEKEQIGPLPADGPLLDCPVQLDFEYNLVRIDPGVQLDLGGIAKGWIVEQTASVLKEEGLDDFIVNAGGDLVCEGDNGGDGWCIGIDHPFEPGQVLATLDIHNLSVATSGTYKRAWRRGGQTVNHLMDPRTGRSTASDIVLCTVVHTDLVEAEVLAKCALLLGKENGVALLEERQPTAWMMMTSAKERIASCNL